MQNRSIQIGSVPDIAATKLSNAARALGRQAGADPDRRPNECPYASNPPFRRKLRLAWMEGFGEGLINRRERWGRQHDRRA